VPLDDRAHIHGDDVDLRITALQQIEQQRTLTGAELQHWTGSVAESIEERRYVTLGRTAYPTPTTGYALPSSTTRRR
jgi:hypothetical protein